MKSIRTTSSVHAAEGDERIRTAVPALGADPAYEAHKFGGVRPKLHPKDAATPSIQRRVETTVTRGRTYGGRLLVHPRTRIRLGGAELGPAATVNAEKPPEATTLPLLLRSGTTDAAAPPDTQTDGLR